MTPAHRSSRASRAATWAVAIGATLLALGNAVAWWGTLSDRHLVVRQYDYEWELSLAWRAARGEWSGVHFAYPIGPLTQLLSLVGSLGEVGAPERVIGGMHLVFPLLSIALAALVARAAARAGWRRVLAFAALCLLALHDDVRSLRALLSLAVVVAFTALHEQADPSREWRRAAVVAAALVAAAGLSLDGGLLGALSLASMSAGELVATREPDGRRAVALRALRVAAVAVLALGAWALVAELAGAGALAMIREASGIVRAYSVNMAADARELDAGNVVAFGLLAFATLPLLFTRRFADRTARMWMIGALPLLLRGALRTDAEHAYAATMPLVAVLVLVVLRAVPERPGLAAHGGLLASLFLLGWLATDARPVAAWHPGRLLVAARVLARGRQPEPYESDLGRVTDFARRIARERPRCVGFPVGMGVAQVVAGLDGPAPMQLRWSSGMQEQLARSIRSSACPYFVQRIASFDRPYGLGSWGLGADFVARCELYEPIEQLGPATFASALRATPAPSARFALPASGVPGAHRVGAGGRLEVRFGRRVPLDRLVEITYRAEASRLSQLLGSAPWVTVQVHDGATPIGEPMVFPGLELGAHAAQVIPLHPEIAEWRWVTGRRPERILAADRLTFEVHGRALTAGGLTLELVSLAELAPPEVREPPRAACDPVLDLAARVRAGGGFVRHAPPARADHLDLPTGPPREPRPEVFVTARPCESSCLLAEVELAQGDAADLEIHLVDGPERPRELRWAMSPGAPRPIELPLARVAGRDVMLRFGASGPQGSVVRVLRPRIAPCAALVSLVTRVHEGAYSAHHGTVRVSGDQLELTLQPPWSPPVELRIPVTVPRESACLAADLMVPAPWSGVPFSVDVGVLEGDVVHRRTRPAVWREEQLVRVRDVDLRAFAGRDVQVRFAARPLTRTVWEGTAVVARPRLHRCGDGAPWGFGSLE